VLRYTLSKSLQGAKTLRLRTLLTVGILVVLTGCAPAGLSQQRPSHGAEPVPALAGAESVRPAAQPDTPPQGQTRPQSGTTATATATATAPAAKPPAAQIQPAATVQPQPDQPAAPPAAKAVPRLAILVYHDVAQSASGGYTISQAQFESQLQMLKDEGYAFYRLADVERLLAGGEGLPEKAVMLAFDDGYQSFATHVLPVARQYNVPAVCFAVTKYMDFDIIFGLPHMSTVELKEVAASGLLELAGHSYDGHRTAETADGSHRPVLINRIRKPQSTLIETDEEYAARVRNDFAMTATVLKDLGAGIGSRHFTFPFTARSDEAVSLGRAAGFQYFYIGGEQLVRPDTDPGAIPRVHAGAPEISAEVLRDRLRALFAQP